MKGYTPPPRMVVSNEPMPITRNITITEGISVKDLAEKLDVRAKDLISRLLGRGVFATINQTLDAELASEMARFFGAETNVITFEEQASKDIDAAAGSGEDSAIEITPRPPVVTIMGHVDHGKTTLLDSIRETSVAEGEAGGITQHIGAYKVRITDKESPAYGREIVFLDTPGHEAFTRMRSRGAKATDIVVLVVAADDGVMPQTIEAIDHAHAAEVPIIVAVNKIDKPDALPDRVKKQLGDRGLVPEEWGGKTVFVDVSAKKKTNLNLLMEMICLVADLAELKATPERAATGVVLEAKLDRGRGPVATVLVQNGTLIAGDNFVVGNVYGKIRAMFDDRGAVLASAPPSTPVEILGMEGLPQAGDQFVVVADRDKARGISEYREQKAREAALAKSSRVSLEGLAEQIKTAGTKELNIILKGDVQGSVEVLSDLLSRLSNERVRLRLLRSGVGAITETDVLLASASNAIIIGFNVRPERKAQELAEQEEVDIRLHSIIYELQDEIKRNLPGPRRGARNLPHSEGRNRRGMSSARWFDQTRLRSPPAAGQRRRVQRQDWIATPLQGRCQRSHQRHGMRHLDRKLWRHQSPRCDRGLCYRADRSGSYGVRMSSQFSVSQFLPLLITENGELRTECPSPSSPSNCTSKPRSRSRIGGRQFAV